MEHVIAVEPYATVRTIRTHAELGINTNPYVGESNHHR
jgi:hypothetical protein